MPEKQYTEQEIERAVAAVQAKVPIRKAARTYGIPTSTLRDRLKGALPIRQSQKPFQRLGPAQEKGLADWIRIQASLGLPPTHAEVRFFAEEILRREGTQQALGKRWIRRFLQRYPEIRVGRGRRIESARAKGVTTAIIRQWWEYLQIPEVAGIKPENTYNADGGGLQEGKTGNGLVLGLAEARHLQKKNRGSHLDVVYQVHLGHWGLASSPHHFQREIRAGTMVSGRFRPIQRLGIHCNG
ncbi:hypothetical protein RB595_010701 [Gaeumannomyces hyphopodioides]